MASINCYCLSACALRLAGLIVNTLRHRYLNTVCVSGVPCPVKSPTRATTGVGLCFANLFLIAVAPQVPRGTLPNIVGPTLLFSAFYLVFLVSRGHRVAPSVFSRVPYSWHGATRSLRSVRCADIVSHMSFITRLFPMSLAGRPELPLRRGRRRSNAYWLRR